jgi:hypothetical protein
LRDSRRFYISIQILSQLVMHGNTDFNTAFAVGANESTPSQLDIVAYPQINDGADTRKTERQNTD